MKDFLILGPKIYTEKDRVENAALRIENGMIAEIFPSSKINSHPVIEFPRKFHLVPGFIDLHIHGAKGKDVMDGTHEALKTISATLAEEGVTQFLATTMTAEPKHIENVLQVIHDYQQTQHQVAGAHLLGVHLEGPFLSPHKVGAQRADKILLPDIDLVQQWNKHSMIKMITLAPELSNSDAFIRYLIQENVVASIGHTNATYDQTVAAIDAGCTHFTHLFNAMRGIHHREPGAVTAALLSEDVTVELIVDGVHLHPAIVQLVLSCKNKNNIILVTDAMRAKCMCDGVYDLGEQTVHVEKGIARLNDGVLAGSTLTMPNAIKKMMDITGCALRDVIPFVSMNPAKLLKIFHRTGSITQGKSADLVVLNDKFEVEMTICAGKICFLQKKNAPRILHGAE